MPSGTRACEPGRHESALDFFARYEQLVDTPALDLQYFRGISYWYADRREEALAAMASFRSRSPRDPRAFPEEMESAHAERTDPDGEAPAAEVFLGFRIRLMGDVATPIRADFEIRQELGEWSQQKLEKREVFVTFPGLPPEVGGIWELSVLKSRSYQGVASEPMRWPVRETLVLKAIDGDAPDIAVEIESLQYTYKAGIEGPLVAYPASADGGPTA